MVSVTLNLGSDGTDRLLVAVKLQAPSWEFNFWATPEELGSLRRIRETDWDTRNCLRVGTSAGAAVFWSARGETADIMVGDDEETWDIGLTVPTATVEEIAAEAAAESW